MPQGCLVGRPVGGWRLRWAMGRVAEEIRQEGHFCEAGARPAFLELVERRKDRYRFSHWRLAPNGRTTAWATGDCCPHKFHCQRSTGRPSQRKGAYHRLHRASSRPRVLVLGLPGVVTCRALPSSGDDKRQRCTTSQLQASHGCFITLSGYHDSWDVTCFHAMER